MKLTIPTTITFDAEKIVQLNEGKIGGIEENEVSKEITPNTWTDSSNQPFIKKKQEK